MRTDLPDELPGEYAVTIVFNTVADDPRDAIAQMNEYMVSGDFEYRLEYYGDGNGDGKPEQVWDVSPNDEYID